MRASATGGGGRDVIIGGFGADTLYGDGGQDLFFISLGDLTPDWGWFLGEKRGAV